jgi:hypothetical protein
VFNTQIVSTLSFPLLAGCGGVQIQATTGLANISFPALVTSNSDIVLSGNSALVGVDFPVLSVAPFSRLQIYSNPHLVAVNFPAISVIASLSSM